uniref:Fibronectin type-III domain-containing protein n=1 Tax=Amphimedon queenslandica TaxID=400682 RepID=A0A1X7UFF4_AMPQE
MISLIRLNLLLSVAISIEGIFLLKPESTIIAFVDKLLTLRCSTNSSYLLIFTYNTPSGNELNPQSKTEELPGGVTLISTTFLVTKELDTTNVTCSAAGTSYHSAATITTYTLPNGLSNIKVCQLDHFVFVSWDKIFAPKGINITYSISDNRGLQTVINNSSYSFFLNETSEINYYVSITVIGTAPAANQTDNSSITTLPYKLNGTVRLDLSYDKDNSSRVGTKWLLLFKVELHHLHPDQCIIDNETLKGASVMNCLSSSDSCINSTSVHYDEHNNEINSTNLLPAREKYNSTLCFNYLGTNIISQPVQTSKLLSCKNYSNIYCNRHS